MGFLGEYESFCKDIALRDSTLLEKIIIAGFPKISKKVDDYLMPIVQSGEISGRIESYNEQSQRIQLELFTAIAHPGNSGGPVISADGKLLGLVTQSLERDREETDIRQSVFPYFAAIPASEIFKSFNELNIANEYNIPWEDYQ